MRIVHSAPHCNEVGNGVVNVAVDLACKQASAGHSVAFMGGRGSLCSLLQSYGVTHIEVDQSLSRFSAIRSFAQLRRALADFAPDIVHAHMVPGAVLARLARVGLNFRLITTVHNAPQRQAVLMGLGDLVIAVSDKVSDSMARRGVPARKLRVVKNGTLGSPRQRHPAPVDEIRLRQPAIVTVARLFRQKGIDDLISAFAIVARAFPEASLYIVGEGPERADFERQAARTDCGDRIHFVGFTPNPRPYLDQAEVFVLASRADPFPLVIPEAREAGCAIIATAVDGIPEGLDHGEAGILVPPSNPHALAASLERLLANPDELQRWRARAAANLGWLRLDRVNEETMSVYAEALASANTPSGMRMIAGERH